MKLTAGLIVTLAGCAAATQPDAEVYLVPAREASSTTPSISPSLARLVLLQRLAPIGQGPSLHDVPKGVGTQEAVSVMNRFGKVSPPLFVDCIDGEPSQLVMMLEEMTEKQMKELGHALERKPEFTIFDPPSSKAHDDLVKTDFHNAGVTNGNNCDMRQVVNPLEECWNGKQSAVAKYNVKKDPTVLEEVIHKLAQLSQLAKSGELETTIVLLPSTTSSKSWSDKPQELRRRQAEQVMASLEKTVAPAAPTSSAADNTAFYASRGPMAACFSSKEACISATGNCSEHGACLNKYANSEGKDGKEICYACHCLSTRSESGSLTHWAGPSCAKSDISVAFWLFAGFTLALVSILWLAISMLFNVGEEKLPGVIGAGVSRAK
ncbi:Putative endoplasmic reticulum membrane protein [Tolypocladium paradoxum]|uniref:Endoplasmic reticulum membrane protein n=1 Tax=Tolypocladium paradoxum TaxID=94208 RepID=A0A2S4KNC3_9HYPO|nr:Putative endoplasmic reticulum membrane protein [Tolypocladium paradoxum]